MQKKRFCNFRPFLIIAISIMIAIFFAVFVVNNSIAQFLLFSGLLFLAVICFALFFIKKNKLFIFLTTLLLFVAVPFLTINLKTYKYDSYSKYENSEVLILGKVSEHHKITKNGYLAIVVDDVEISSAKDDVIENIDGKIIIYTNPEYIDISKLNIGRYVFANIKLDFNSLKTSDRWELSDLSKDIVAGGFTRYYNIKIYDEKDNNFANIIKDKVYDTLINSNMNNADVAYAMMFGDSAVVDSDIRSIFQSTGIAHLLAVSGLHVSAIVFAISFILKKMKLSHKVQFILLGVILSFYCYLCNFSISVIRASLMAIILNYSYIRGKAYDRLSVLSMLAAVILLINPIQLFNISFILSFSAVFSIILLAEPITRIFNKIFYNKFSNTLGILFAVQIGLTVVNIFYFHTFQPLSFLANMVSIPIATFAFILIIAASLLVMIFPILGSMCQWIGELFVIISQYNNYIRNFGLSVSLPAIPAIIIPITFLLLFLISDYCFINKKIKIYLASLLCICYGALIFV